MKPLLIISAVFAAQSALAVPTYFPEKPKDLALIQNSTNSTLLGDNVDSGLAWVLPPLAGKVEPQQFKAASANVGFCKEMSDLQSYSRQLAATISKKSQDLQDKEEDLNKAYKELSDARMEQADYVDTNRDLQKVVDLEARISDVDDQLSKLNEQQKNCQGPACDKISDEIDSYLDERRQLVKDAGVARDVVRAEYKKYLKLKNKVAAAQANVDDVLEPIQKIQSALAKARKEMQDAYSSFAKLEGGFAVLDYNTGWDQNVASLRTANPNQRFEKISTRKAVVNIGFVGSKNLDTYLASLPQILDYVVNGQKVTPTDDVSAQELAAMPEKLTATLRLSLVGACPLLHPKDFDLVAGTNGMPVFGVSAQYEIPANFYTKVRFSYNLYKVYEVIKSSGSSGGFFHTESWSSVSENNYFRDAVKFDWVESDPDNKMTFEDRIKIEQEVKNDLIQRVLRNMGVPDIGQPVSLGSAPPVPEHGAVIIATGLAETCGYVSYYCAAGAWILRGLDSIFGSSSVENRFKQTFDMESTDEWSINQAHWKPAVTVFATK